MSVLTYNKIILPYCSTTEYEQVPLYDEASNTDWCGTKFVIAVNAVLNAELLSTIAPQYASLGIANAAAVMKQIRIDLLQPRRALSFTFNGVNVLPSRAGVAGTVDSRNGPIPKSCSIIQLNNTTFLCLYRIEAVYWEKYSGTDRTNNLPGNNVLYNRWSETISIDSCLYSRRHRQGKYMIRSDNVDGVTADEVRSQIAVVGCPTGFVRESSEYTVSPDGLAIQYNITDKEVFKMPPSPAYEARGKFTMSSPKGGAITYVEANIHLRGPKNNTFCPQTKLIQTAIAVCQAKLGINGVPSNAIIEYCSLSVDMYDNAVDYAVKARRGNTPSRNNGTPMTEPIAGANICFTPGSQDGTPQPAYYTRGTACLLLQAASYWDASIRGTVLGPGEQGDVEENVVANSDISQNSTGLVPGQAGQFKEV